MWTEYPRGGNFCPDGECFTRVHAAVAMPGAPFGRSSLISDLGNVSPRGPVGAIGDGGALLVSWANRWRDVAHNPLMVMLGSPLTLARRTPRKPLKVAVAVSRQALRAAA